MIADYWADGKRAYHHTAPITMVYALRESLRIVLEEGLEPRFARHRLHSKALMAGLAALGCAPNAQEGHRLPSLNCIPLPAGVDEAAIRKALLLEFNIEIGGGLGPLAGKVWRIGLMGESLAPGQRGGGARRPRGAAEAGRQVQRPGAAVAAALEVYAA